MVLFHSAGATAYDPNSDQSVPDTSQQVEKYLGDFRDGTTHPGTDRVLYVIWVGINTIDSIWKESEAEAMITTQVQHIGSQMESLVKNSLTNRYGLELAFLFCSWSDHRHLSGSLTLP